MRFCEGFVSVPPLVRRRQSVRISCNKFGSPNDAVLPRKLRVRASIAESSRPEVKTKGADSGTTFSWTEQWYAVCIEVNAPVDEPYAFKLFDSELVLFRTSPGCWSVLDDQCSHRLAPLSEGRIATLPGNEGTAVLECAYHGWSFKGCGQCACIPQIEKDKGATIPRRADIRSYPTAVKHRIIWVWLGEPENADPARIPAPPGISRYTEDQMSVCFSRFVPYGLETLVENLSDAEHVCFAHHGANRFMNRSMGGKMNMYASRVEPTRIISMRSPKGSDQEPSPDGGELLAPCSLFYDYTIPSVGSSLSWFVFGPVTRTKSHLFVISYSNFAKLPAIVRFMQKVKPMWLDHFDRNLILDGDSVLLNSLQRKAGDPSTWQEKYLPVGEFDGFVYEVRKWMDEHRDSMPWLTDPSVGQTMDPSARREELIERFHSHTEHCKACLGAMKGFERAEVVAEWIAKIAVVALIAVFVSAYVGNAAILTGEKLRLVQVTSIALLACIVLSLYARRSFAWFKSQFIYSDEARRRIME